VRSSRDDDNETVIQSRCGGPSQAYCIWLQAYSKPSRAYYAVVWRVHLKPLVHISRRRSPCGLVLKDTYLPIHGKKATVSPAWRSFDVHSWLVRLRIDFCSATSHLYSTAFGTNLIRTINLTVAVAMARGRTCRDITLRTRVRQRCHCRSRSRHNHLPHAFHWLHSFDHINFETFEIVSCSSRKKTIEIFVGIFHPCRVMFLWITKKIFAR